MTLNDLPYDAYGLEDWWSDIQKQGRTASQKQLDALKLKAVAEAKKLGAVAGEAAQAPVAEETVARMKQYLPWILLSVVGVMFIGGFMGGKTARGRR
jgi:hypothetical protein